MEARGHEEDRACDAPERGIHAYGRCADTTEQDEPYAEPVLFHQQQEWYYEEAQQSRHFAQSNDEAVVRRGEAAYFYSIVGVQQ